MAIDLHSASAGLLVGLLVGLTGIGGGALMTPILVLILGTAPKTAVGTDLLFAAITKMAGVAVHGQRGTIDWRICRRMATGSLPAALMTGLVLHLFGGNSLKVDAVIMYGLGYMLVLTAVGLVFKTRFHVMGRHLRVDHVERFKHLQGPLTVLAGVFLGVAVTLTSVGAGALGTVIMLYLYPLRLTPSKVVGTDLAHAIPLALVAGAGHWMAGNVDYHLLSSLLLGSIPGVLFGSWLSSRAPEGILRFLLALLLLATGLKILLA
jgi:uncharacterized membrane protein YfcA